MDLFVAPNTVPRASADLMPIQGQGGYLTNGNPAAGVPASGDYACNMNMILGELMQVLTDGGIEPDRSDWTQLSQAIRALIAKVISASLGPNGYIKIPTAAGDPLILQWGQIAGQTAGAATGGVYESGAIGIEWPTPFTTACYGALAGAYDIVGSGYNERAWISPNPGLAGCTAWLACSAANQAMTGFFVAIGC